MKRSNALSIMKNVYKLVDLIHLSKIEDTVTIEATVDTGFEKLAEEECRSKLGVQLPACVDRGRVYFNIPASRYFLVPTLRSVNNLSLVVHLFENIWSSLAEEKNKETDLEVIGNLIYDITWEKYLNFWQNVIKFKGNLYPSETEYLNLITQVSNKDELKTKNDEEIDTGTLCTIDHVISQPVHDILRFRVTCYRSGQHSFGSQDAARSFGGKLQDRFHWCVNLDDYQLEVILHIKNGDVKVMLSLTEISLHKRNITHYGLTTLRSTVAFNLLQVAKPQLGELIMDPMCGSGAIPIEGAAGIDGTFYLCGDIAEKLVQLTNANKLAFDESREGRSLLLDTLHWNVCALPLRNACIDVVTTDLPFGKRVGSKRNNRTLYPNAFRELARVVRPGVGRAVLFTTDRNNYNLSLHRNKKYWRQMKMMVVKLGGLKVCVYLLKRTWDVFMLESKK